MEKHRRSTRKQIEAHLFSQQESGLTVYKYCKEHGIGRQTFYSWRKRYGKAAVDVQPEQSFVELKMAPAFIEDRRVIAELEHPKGYRIAFNNDCPAEYLSRLIKQL